MGLRGKTDPLPRPPGGGGSPRGRDERKTKNEKGEAAMGEVPSGFSDKLLQGDHLA